MTSPELRGDANVRSLERATRAAPGDALGRLELARALVRAGRRGEALDALDLATFEGPGFEEARGLWDELWASELAGLEPTDEIELGPRPSPLKVDPSGRFLVCVVERGRLLFVDTVTGERLAVEEGTGNVGLASACATRDALFARSGGEATLTRVTWGTGRLVAEKTRCEDYVLAADPEGARVLLWRSRPAQIMGIYRWPSLEPVVERPGGHATNARATNHAQVSWELERFIDDMATRCEVVDFAGNVVAVLERRRKLDSWVLDGRFLRQHEERIELHDLITRRQIEVIPRGFIPPRRAVPEARFSPERRALHSYIGGALRSCELDLEAGVVTTPLDERKRWTDAHTSRDHGASLHPRACAATLKGRERMLELHTREGAVHEWEDARVHAWSADGHTLLLGRGVAIAPLWGNRLELWRTPTSRERNRKRTP